MKEYNFIVRAGEAGQRLDICLTRYLPNSISRSRIQKLIAGGHIQVNEKPTKAHHKLREGEQIKATVPLPTRIEAKPEKIPLDIVYEDGHLLVINKAPGMVVHPAAGNYSGTLVNALLAHCENLSGVGGDLKPGIVHRLDKDTSGLMVVAKSDEAHQGLARQFKEHTVFKKYVAVVQGRMPFDEGLIDEPVGRHPRHRKKMTIVQAGGRHAITHYKTLQRFETASLVEFTPKTGRTHQIRAHISYIGHPLVGDSEYGRRSPLIGRQALHAETLGFDHPANGKHLEFTKDIPKDMKRLIERLRG